MQLSFIFLYYLKSKRCKLFINCTLTIIKANNFPIKVIRFEGKEKFAIIFLRDSVKPLSTSSELYSCCSHKLGNYSWLMGKTTLFSVSFEDCLFYTEIRKEKTETILCAPCCTTEIKNAHGLLDFFLLTL